MAKQPPNTRTANVFNFGIQKNIPLGFVDVVYDKKTNDLIGFMDNGRFYNLGEKVVEPKKKVSSEDVSRKVDLLERKLNLLELQVTSPGIKGPEKSRLIAEYNKTQDEFNQAKRDLDSKLLQEGKIDQEEAANKAAETLRFEIRALREREKLMGDLGQNTAQIRGEIRGKESALQSLGTPIEQRVAPSEAPNRTATEFLRERRAPLPGESKPKDAEVILAGERAGVVSGGTGAGVTGAATPPARGAKEEDKKPKLTPEQRYEQALLTAQEKYSMPDIIFNNVPSLGDILKQFVEGKIDENGFRFRIENDIWYRQNSQDIRNRYLQIFNYNDLKSKGQALGTTAFEQQLRTISEQIQDQALAMTGSRISDEEAVETIAKDLYTFGLEGSTNEMRQRIAKFIRPVTSRIGEKLTEGFGGEAKANYDALYATARANGFTLEDVLPKDAEGKPLPTTDILQRIATGKLDVNRIQDDIRRLAAQGRPDYVKDLLAQGSNLDEIYLPYKMQMAKTLEIANPNAIDLKDPSLQMAITKDGDMNLFDYEKALRKDSRWQYTEGARDEVAGVLDTVLRDFGFRS